MSGKQKWTGSHLSSTLWWQIDPSICVRIEYYNSAWIKKTCTLFRRVGLRYTRFHPKIDAELCPRILPAAMCVRFWQDEFFQPTSRSYDTNWLIMWWTVQVFFLNFIPIRHHICSPFREPKKYIFAHKLHGVLSAIRNDRKLILFYT